MEAIIVISTFPNIESARQIGTLLVERQLVACVNLLPGVESLYSWQGAICQDQEIMAVMKTSNANYSAIEALMNKHHPYDVPALSAVKLSQVPPTYLDWMISVTK